MTQDKFIEEVANLFMETGKNHHQAFIETDGVDPEWPIWYADHLYPKLGKLINAQLTKSEIIYLILTLENQRAMDAPGADWPRYYAKILFNRYL